MDPATPNTDTVVASATVTAKELRNHLKRYLDQVENGTTVTIIRNSLVIGSIVPSDEVMEFVRKARPDQHMETLLQTPLGVIIFRRWQTSDKRQIASFYGESYDFELDGIADYYIGNGGDFIVGVLGGVVVAAGTRHL